MTFETTYSRDRLERVFKQMEQHLDECDPEDCPVPLVNWASIAGMSDTGFTARLRRQAPTLHARYMGHKTRWRELLIEELRQPGMHLRKNYSKVAARFGLDDEQVKTMRGHEIEAGRIPRTLRRIDWWDAVTKARVGMTRQEFAAAIPMSPKVLCMYLWPRSALAGAAILQSCLTWEARGGKHYIARIHIPETTHDAT